MRSKLNGIISSKRGALRAIAIGDSITAMDAVQAGSGLWTQGNGWFEQIIRWQGYDGPFTFVRNAGVAGNTAQQMLARLDTDVLAYAPDVLFIMAGTNNILTGATNTDYANCMNAIEQMVLRCLVSGVDVVLSTPPAKDGAKLEMNKAIPFYFRLAQHYGLPLLDAHRATVDPVTGGYRTGLSDDGTHPNQAGIKEIMNEWQTIIRPGFQDVFRARVAETAAGSITNYIRNGNFVKNTTPPAMDNWTVNTTGATFTQDAPGLSGGPVHLSGKVFDYVKTAAGGAYALYGTDADSGYADGDTLVFSGLFGCTAIAASPTGYTMLLQFGSADSVRPYNSTKRVQGSLEAFSQEFVVPTGYAGVNALLPQLFVQDAGTYLVGELTLWNKTKYDAIWKPGALLNV